MHLGRLLLPAIDNFCVFYNRTACKARKYQHHYKPTYNVAFKSLRHALVIPFPVLSRWTVPSHDRAHIAYIIAFGGVRGTTHCVRCMVHGEVLARAHWHLASHADAFMIH